MNGLRNSNFQDNEIVKASDVQLVGDVSIENLGKAMKTLFGSTKSVVIGGKIKKYSGGSGLVAVLSPVIGIRGGEETVFVSEDGEFYPEDSVEPSSIITFPNSGTSARRDIVEVRAEVITTNEQSRQFYDPETESSSYSQTDVEQRQILRLKIKKGTNGSDTAPATDSGFVKIAEVLIPANATAIEDSNIYNVTADIEGIDNANWTNDKQITINPGTLSDISTKFRNIHNSNGTLKDSVIAASKIILSGTGALQGSGIQKGGNKETIDGKEVAATTSISDFIGKIVARLNKIWEPECGGTGKTSLDESANALINSLSTGDSDPVDTDYFISQFVKGNEPKAGEDPKITYHRRSMIKLWNYIQGKISSVLGLSVGTDGKKSYSGTSAAANKLSTAQKLKVALGSTADATFDGSSAQESIPVSGALPIANGGTGATTVAAARNNLGLGNTNGALPIGNGGTGATTVAAARNNLGLGNTNGALPIANGGTGFTTAGDGFNALGAGTTLAEGAFTDDTEFITSNAEGYNKTGKDTNFYRRKLSLMKEWIKSLIGGATGLSYTAPATTTGAGTLAVSYGTTANTACQGNDSRLSNSRTPTSHASSNTTYGVADASNYGHAKASSTTPKANGTASAGSETGTFARGDHVHPLQTSVSGSAGSATYSAQSKALGNVTISTSSSTAAHFNAIGTIAGKKVTVGTSATFSYCTHAGTTASTTISWGTSGNYRTIKSSECDILFVPNVANTQASVFSTLIPIYVKAGATVITTIGSRDTPTGLVICAVEEWQ